jgi:CRP-like cAMP-binding protein
MPEEIAELVANHPLLAGLPGDTVELVTGCTRNVAFSVGDLLLAEGDPADTLYLLRRGRVALEVRAPGKAMIIDILSPGQPLGWSWLFPPYRWSFDARALDPVGALSVDAACLRAKAEADPAFGYELMKRISAIILQRLQAARLRLLDLYGDGVAG